MAIKLLRRAARKIGHRLGLMTDWEVAHLPRQIVGREQTQQWYDELFETTPLYHCHYSRSCYYFLWSVITDRILRSGYKAILEIGCGPGQLAALLYDQGIRQYTGLDFSTAAVELAQKNVPMFRFLVADARTSTVCDDVPYDVIICTEVLEHIEDDLLVVSRFKPRVRCMFTVPNFPNKSHVRVFRDADEVSARYAPYFSEFQVLTLQGPRDLTERFYLADGVRNEWGRP
jgi:SAM-dependent methyltransferase